MSVISTATNPNLVNPAIMQLVDEAREQIVAKELQYKKFPFTIWQIENINGDIASSMSGVGAGSLTVEGQAFADDAIYDGYNKTLISRYYTKRLEFTEQFKYSLEQKKQAGIIKLASGIKGYMQGLYLNWEQDFAKMFYLGAGTTFVTGGDSLALFSASHPAKKPGVAVQSNIITVGGVTNPVLNATSLRGAFLQGDRFVDNAGVLMGGMRRPALVVAPKNREIAYQLKWSAYGPDTANLGLGLMSPAIASKTGKSFEVIVLDHIPDAFADYWFVVDLDRMESQVYMAQAWEPRALSNFIIGVNGAENLLFSTQFGPNPVDWRWALGSTGANPTA